MLNDFGESKVTVKKSELLAAIRTNCQQHREAFIEAQKGYRDEVIKVLDETLESARNGSPFVLQKLTQLIPPQEHTKDYQRVIKMLEMCVADEVTVTEQQFQQYVLDDWGWKQQFTASVASYSKGGLR